MKNFTFEQFRKQVNQFAKDFPDAASLPVVTSSDDEGNSFHGIFYSPSVVTVEVANFGDNEEIKTVCIN